MKLSIALATRGRPRLLLATLKRTLANIEREDTTLVVCVDADDEATLANIETLKRVFTPSVHLDVRAREDSLGEKYGRVLEVAPADLYLAMVDYAPHVTRGFDSKLLEAASVFPDGIGVVYNRMANMSFPEINAVTAGLAQKMGFMYPPYFPYWFVDHWLDDVARMIDRISFADVLVDTSNRPGTLERREPGFWALLYDALVIERRESVERIICDPEFIESNWRKQLLLRNIPLHEQRSRWLNTFARTSCPPSGEPPDARYMHVRARAEEKMRELLGQLEAQAA